MIQKFLKNLKESLVSNILLCLGILLSLFAGILYINTGVTNFVTELDTLTIVLPFVAFGIGLLAVIFPFKTAKYLAFLASLFAFLSFLRIEVTYIVNVFVGIDGNSFTPTFLMNFIALIVAFLAFLVSAILQKEILFRKEEPKMEEQQ